MTGRDSLRLRRERLGTRCMTREETASRIYWLTHRRARAEGNPHGGWTRESLPPAIVEPRLHCWTGSDVDEDWLERLWLKSEAYRASSSPS